MVFEFKPLSFLLAAPYAALYCSSCITFITEHVLISAIASAVILLLCRNRDKNNAPSPARSCIFSPAAVVISVVYAAAYFLSDSFSMKCTALIPLSIQASLSFCLPVLCTAALEYIVFRQKLTKFDYLQIVCALACSICFVLG